MARIIILLGVENFNGHFMAKHPAWAAAMSSSGLVPTPSANRELKEYCVLFNTVLADDKLYHLFPTLSSSLWMCVS